MPLRLKPFSQKVIQDRVWFKSFVSGVDTWSEGFAHNLVCMNKPHHYLYKMCIVWISYKKAEWLAIIVYAYIWHYAYIYQRIQQGHQLSVKIILQKYPLPPFCMQSEAMIHGLIYLNQLWQEVIFKGVVLAYDSFENI